MELLKAKVEDHFHGDNTGSNPVGDAIKPATGLLPVIRVGHAAYAPKHTFVMKKDGSRDPNNDDWIPWHEPTGRYASSHRPGPGLEAIRENSSSMYCN
jgi:hypothetical protein